MNVKKIVFIIPVVLMVVLGWLAFLMNNTLEQLSTSEKNRFDSYIVADELRQASADLTRLARSYVITGDSKYEDLYWAILDWQNGKSSRPTSFALEPGNTIKQRQIMKNLGFTNEEFGLLDQAATNSNDLVETETIAMNAIKGKELDGKTEYRGTEPAKELASRIMFDTKYHSDVKSIMAPIDNFFSLLNERTSLIVKDFKDEASTRLTFVFVALIALAISIVIAVMVNKKILVDALSIVVKKLMGISNQVTIAANQVTQSSQTLAQGSSEQTASLEETTAALNEMASMSQKNAENSHQAQTVASDAKITALTGQKSMDAMKAAIHAIQSSSQETSKIIKDINEIAFQTNLLALNAAVEAARAGEAGKGFAVVAEEVRNLAQRSAEAAQNTADKIEESMKNSDNGVAILNEVASSFEEISQRTEKVDTIISEIAVASNEQTTGVNQVTESMLQIEKINMTNSASAEESAGSAEELNAEASNMQSIVDELASLIGNKNSMQTQSYYEPIDTARQISPQHRS
ncbi:MAG: methyl-accepting chemotaxis protein [Fibrobacterales bacterium]